MCEEVIEEGRDMTSNEQEVADLRAEFFADGKIDEKEVAKLIDLKKEKSGDTSYEFDNFYAECMVAFLVSDGVLDKDKAKTVNELLLATYESDGEEYLGDDLDDCDYELFSQLNDEVSESDVMDIFPRLA